MLQLNLLFIVKSSHIEHSTARRLKRILGGISRNYLRAEMEVHHKLHELFLVNSAGIRLKGEFEL